MKYLLLGLLLPALAACQVDNNIADDGESGSTEARVAAKSGDFCTSTCDRLSQCDIEGLVDPDDCVGECQELFEQEFLHRGEACAQAAERFMSCISRSSCDDFANDTKRCELSPSEEAACDEGDDPPVAIPPDQIPDGPSTDDGGPISCLSAGAGGSLPAADNFNCESTSEECSDGHTYAVSCSETPQGPPLCTCSVDGGATTSFSLVELTCPSQAEMNLGCGFWIFNALQPEGIYPEPVTCTGGAGGGAPIAGNGCSVDLSDCGGSAYQVDCVGSGGTERCTCYVDGEPTGSFHDPAGFCPSTGTAEELMRMNMGCAWYLTGF